MLTLTEAAERAGTSRSTVFRWIKSGKVSATKTEDGQFRIDESELARVLDSIATARSAEHAVTRDAMPAAVPPDAELRLRNAMLESEVAGLRALVDAERRRADAAERDRDRWAAQAERLALAPPARSSTVPAVPAAPRSWWRWR